MYRWVETMLLLFLEQILIEHIEFACRLESKLFFTLLRSIRIQSRKQDISEKPLWHISNPYVFDLRSYRFL